MIKILIADDHPIVRRGMGEILSQESDLKVVAEAGNVAEILEALRRSRADVLLLDLNMPGKSGLDAISDILRQFKGIRILVMSAYPEDQFAKRVLRAGALGYLSKDTAPDQLVTAVRKIAFGHRFVTPAIAELLAEDLGDRLPARPHDILSDRELQVLLHLANGKSISEIAEVFAISPKTVSTYRTRILQKLKLHSNADITRFALEQRLID